MLLRRRIRTCSKAGKAIDQKVEKSIVTNREAQFALKHPTAYKDILFAKEFNRAGIESGIGAASLTAATTMSHSSHALIEKVGGSCAPAAVVAWGVQSFDAAVSYAQGEISTSELVYDLFVDFKGYVDFFFLQDCVSADYSSVKIWIGDASFKKSGLPETVEEYLQFLVKEHVFLDKRNRRIQEYCIKHDLLL